MDQVITHFNRKYNLTEYEITAGGKRFPLLYIVSNLGLFHLPSFASSKLGPCFCNEPLVIPEVNPDR